MSNEKELKDLSWDELLELTSHEAERDARLRSQSKDAGKLGAKALHTKYSKEQTLEWANMGGTYGKIQGKKNVESGHWRKCHELAKEACYIPILQCDKKTGKIIKEWKSTVHANKETGISKTAISNNLKGLSKSSGGFIWKYKK